MSRAGTSPSNTAGRRIRYDRLPALAADLVRRQVAVIVAAGGSNSALGGQSGDRDNPDRFHHRRRPGQVGLVASLNRPGGNVTGVSAVRVLSLAAKRLELLQ